MAASWYKDHAPWFSALSCGEWGLYLLSDHLTLLNWVYLKNNALPPALGCKSSRLEDLSSYNPFLIGCLTNVNFLHPDSTSCPPLLLGFFLSSSVKTKYLISLSISLFPISCLSVWNPHYLWPIFFFSQILVSPYFSISCSVLKVSPSVGLLLFLATFSCSKYGSGKPTNPLQEFVLHTYCYNFGLPQL